MVRAAFAVLGRLIDRATRWAFPLTSFHLDRLTDDARFGCRYCEIPLNTWTSSEYDRHQAEAHPLHRYPITTEGTP